MAVPTTKANLLTGITTNIRNAINPGDITQTKVADLLEGIETLAVYKDDFGNNTVVCKNNAGTVTYITLSASQILGRKSTGDIVNLVADDVRTIIGLQQTAKISITSGSTRTLNTTPVVLVTSGGTGVVLIPQRIIIRLNYLTAAYATNTTLQVRVGTIAHDLATTVLAAAATQVDIEDITGVFANITSNQAIKLQVKTGNPTAGYGTLDVFVTYTIITIT